jgi:hypothetical protein
MEAKHTRTHTRSIQRKKLQIPSNEFLQMKSFERFSAMSSFDRVLQNSKFLQIPFFIILISIWIKTKRNLEKSARRFSVYALGVKLEQIIGFKW